MNVSSGAGGSPVSRRAFPAPTSPQSIVDSDAGDLEDIKVLFAEMKPFVHEDLVEDLMDRYEIFEVGQ